MKTQNKALAILMSALLFLMSAVSCSSASAAKGDANGDGKISSADARLVLRVAAQLDKAIASFADCDMDENGRLTSVDARVVLRIAARIITAYDPNEELLLVHFIDVGQADCILVERGDYTMLIDGGNVADAPAVLSYLQDKGVVSLDYVVSTHAHEDHVGGLGRILAEIEIENGVFAPKTGEKTNAYDNFCSVVREQGFSPVTPLPGETLSFGGMQVRFLGPITEDEKRLNNTSIVMKLVFGATSFLFTGDAERDEELEIIDSGADLSATVLKVGHHGSESSTSYAFLWNIMPKYAVISVGENNSYGHPEDAVLSRLRDADVQVYRTDLQGTVVARSDGKTVRFSTDKTPQSGDNPAASTTQETSATTTAPTTAAQTYIGNKNSHVFHLPTCPNLPKPSNRVTFNSRDDAVNAGYRACGNCKP